MRVLLSATSPVMKVEDGLPLLSYGTPDELSILLCVPNKMARQDKNRFSWRNHCELMLLPAVAAVATRNSDFAPDHVPCTRRSLLEVR